MVERIHGKDEVTSSILVLGSINLGVRGTLLLIMTIRQHFRKRTPEEDIAILDREPHAVGPLGMAIVNAAGYALLRPESAELLMYAASEAGIALAGITYVHYRFKRGVSRTKPSNRTVEKSTARGFIGADLVPFIGVTGFVGGAQAGLAATLASTDVVRANENGLISSLSDSMALGTGSVLVLGLSSVAAMAYLTRGEFPTPEVGVEKEESIC